MIIDQLAHSSFYYPLNSGIQTALQYLQKTDFSILPAGRYDINGSQIYALVQETTTKPLAEGFWEAHRKYLDIHCPIEGVEKIGFAPIQELSADSEPYHEEKDFQKLLGEGSFYVVRPGMFVLMLPQDAHMPCLAVTTPSPLKKVVVKVAVSLFL